MKKLLLVSLFLMVLAATKAQDKIITLRKDTIECRIMFIGDERISYEQTTSGNKVVGKSIAISDVYEYIREQQANGTFDLKQRETRRQKPERRYLLSIQGGLARSFTDFTAFKNRMTESGIAISEANDYIRKLRNGYHITAGFHYLLANDFGVGVDYSLFYSASEGEFLMNGTGATNLPLYVNLGLNEKLYTHFAGPSFLFRQYPGSKGKIEISETLSPGIVFFRGESRSNEYQIYWDENVYYIGEPPQYYNNVNMVTKSSVFGVKGGISIKYCFSPNLSAGLAGNFIYAKLQKVSFKGFNDEIQDQKLEKEINLSHINYGLTVRYSF